MFQALFARRPANLKDDLLSGLTVALALVPEAVAFALIADVPVMVGLHAAFIMGLFASVFGGRPGMITGATGAMAVVLIGLPLAINQHFGLDEAAKASWMGDVKLQYIYLAVALAGIIQIACGIARLGKFIRMVPHSVMLGFVNGLAIVIFLAQFGSFMVPGTNEWLPQNEIILMLVLAFITMGVIAFIPKLTKAIPAPLAGILVTTGIVLIGGFNTVLVGDLPGMALSELSFWERLPTFHLPVFDDSLVALAATESGITLPAVFSFESLMIILPFSCVLAAVGLIESLMTMSLIDDITETRGRGNRECVGQGLGNLVCGFFQGMGGCAMIGQSMININSGGRGRTSGISAALILLAILLVGGDLIGQIPLAALVGVMFMVVIGTFEWNSLRILHRVPRLDASVVITVTAVTLISHNLALAVFVGVIMAALGFAWRQATHIFVKIKDEGDTRVYHLEGMLFFASITSFRELFQVNEGPDKVVLDFAEARVADHSAIEAIAGLAERFEKAGKELHLRHLSPECTRLLGRAKGVIDVDALTDPNYRVADDALAD